MKVSIDEEAVNHWGLDVPQFLVAFAIKAGVNIEEVLQKLIKRNIIVGTNESLYVTATWNDRIDHILLDSDDSVPSASVLLPLAKDLMDIMPQGMMEGTPYYYKCNSAEVVLSLQKFYKIFDIPCTEDDIKLAVHRYVERFNGDYTYMQLLRNFIYKLDRTTGEISSELASYIEDINDDKKDT